jgi:hypothetical protein
MMRQAKQRGSKEVRAAQAIAKIEASKPSSIVCNNCNAAITDVHVMDSHGMDGINGAFAGVCECGHTTWSLAGQPDVVRRAMVSLQEAIGGESIVRSTQYQRN